MKKPGLIALLFCLSYPLLAAEQSTGTDGGGNNAVEQQAAGQKSAGSSGQQTDGAIAQGNGDTDAEDSEETAEEAAGKAEVEKTSDRFIPTEQISQDLGVSFPVDI